MIKKWKALKNVMPNSQIPYVGDYVRIVCALCNRFKSPRVFDSSKDLIKAAQMLQRVNTINKLEEKIIFEKLDVKRACWEEIHDLSLPDFPVLTVSYLQELKFGTYQVIILRIN